VNHTLFISDLHLEPERPDITTNFLSFLKNQAPKSDALYILGDLFEVWVGDDHLSEFNQSIINALRNLSDSGLPIYFMRGNRDFLISETFIKASGCRFLEDPTKINLYGTPILLTHGDLLCTDDYKHQAFRKYTQNPKFHRYFLALPLSLRLWIAKIIRRSSKKHTRTISYAHLDVTQQAVDKLMSQYNVRLLIHGHTHRPAIHVLNHGSHRIVLGDWHQHGSALVYDETGDYELIYF
jgi:UDP-2,3-diacylglucosamine hydrolase